MSAQKPISAFKHKHAVPRIAVRNFMYSRE